MFTEGRLAATERAQRLGEELAMRNEELSEVAERTGARSFCLTQRSRRHRVFMFTEGRLAATERAQRSPSAEGSGGISNEE